MKLPSIGVPSAPGDEGRDERTRRPGLVDAADRSDQRMGGQAAGHATDDLQFIGLQNNAASQFLVGQPSLANLLVSLPGFLAKLRLYMKMMISRQDARTQKTRQINFLIHPWRSWRLCGRHFHASLCPQGNERSYEPAASRFVAATDRPMPNPAPIRRYR